MLFNKNLSVLIILLLFSGCNKESRGKLDSLKGPNWIFDPYAITTNKNNEEIAAVGMSDKSMGGLKFQIAQAEIDAKRNLAMQINSEVASVARDALNKIEIDNKETFQKEYTQLTLATVDMNLSNVVRTNIYQTPDSDAIVFVRIVMNKTQAVNSLNDALERYKNNMQDKSKSYIVDQLKNDISANAFIAKSQSVSNVNSTTNTATQVNAENVNNNLGSLPK